MSELKDIPEEKVPHVVELFILSGNTRINVEKQADGKWTVRGN
jgi:hypothetical protein